MAAHRYWRIYITANSSGGPHLDIREVELRTSIGGADVTGSGTASASHFQVGNEPAKAFDDNTGTAWYTPSSNLPCWLKYDFGAGNDQDIVEIGLKPWSWTESPRDWVLQYSDDDSAWTDFITVNGQTTWNDTSAFRSFSADLRYDDLSVSGRFWRIRSTTVDGGGVLSIAELSMYTEGSSGDQCTGGDSFASTAYGEGTQELCFDDNEGNYFATNSTASWVGYKFASAKTITHVAITARSSFQSQSPKDFVVEYWDGSAFQTAFSISNANLWSGGQRRVFAASGEVFPGPDFAADASGVEDKKLVGYTVFGGSTSNAAASKVVGYVVLNAPVSSRPVVFVAT